MNHIVSMCECDVYLCRIFIFIYMYRTCHIVLRCACDVMWHAWNKYLCTNTCTEHIMFSQNVSEMPRGTHDWNIFFLCTNTYTEHIDCLKMWVWCYGTRTNESRCDIHMCHKAWVWCDVAHRNTSRCDVHMCHLIFICAIWNYTHT